ncbi:MAG: LysR substrate-binding domain-containing protein, partial [Rhizobacter sp.]|nr:LysR substrate-binding domain-containing protein [Rhizobacter sp.]
LQTTRSMMRSHQVAGHDMIEFAVPHSLAFSFFPHWVMELSKRFSSMKTRLTALNVHDAVMLLTEGSCDLLIAYHHASQPLQLSTERYEALSLGSETLAAYAKANTAGQPLFRLAAETGQKVPFLSYGQGAYLGHLVDVIIRQAPAPLLLEPIYETDMAEGLKAMALEGHGLAFLPGSSVKKELRSKRLVRACEAGHYELTMEVRIYRERPDLARHGKAGALALWEFLSDRAVEAAASNPKRTP